MSSLPEIFKGLQSTYIKPSKQGGIYTLKYQQNLQDYASIIQPQEFYSVKTSKNESRIGTSHTIRSQKKVSFTDTRNIGTSQHHKRASSRNVCSRGSSRQIRKDIFANYGNSRVTFMIGQTAPLGFQQAQSLIHKLNQSIQEVKKSDDLLKQVVQVGSQIKSQILRLNQDFGDQIKQIESSTQKQISRLRLMLSDLRRTSGMEIKVNRTDLNLVEQNLEIISTVLNEIDDRTAQLHQVSIQ